MEKSALGRQQDTSTGAYNTAHVDRPELDESVPCNAREPMDERRIKHANACHQAHALNGGASLARTLSPSGRSRIDVKRLCSSSFLPSHLSGLFDQRQAHVLTGRRKH